MVKDIELIKMGEGAGEEVKSKPPLRAVPGRGRLLAHGQKGRGKLKENKPQQVAEITRRQKQTGKQWGFNSWGETEQQPICRDCLGLKAPAGMGGPQPCLPEFPRGYQPFPSRRHHRRPGVGVDKDN